MGLYLSLNSLFWSRSSHPRRVRLSAIRSFRGNSRFQSTHPQGVRRSRNAHRLPSADVSIHAPVKGATHHKQLFAGPVIVSIHAPTKGATKTKNYKNTTNMFQSTHPRRVRRHSIRSVTGAFSVSIHAPTKGATKITRHCGRF